MKVYQYEVYKDGRKIAIMTAREILNSFGLKNVNDYAKRGIVYRNTYTFVLRQTQDNLDDIKELLLEWDCWRNKFLRRGFQRKG